MWNQIIVNMIDFILITFRHKSDLARLLKLIHTMGGSVVKDVGKKVSMSHK